MNARAVKPPVAPAMRLSQPNARSLPYLPLPGLCRCTPWGKTKAKGTVTLIDPNTMEWTYTEYAMGGLMKTLEMHGTSKRMP